MKKRLMVWLMGCMLLQLWMMPAQSAEEIHMARATWDTGWFQAEIYRQLLQELGYRVPHPRTMGNAEAYNQMAEEKIDFWPNGWFPAHRLYYIKSRSVLQSVGQEVKAGALQGILVDKKTARDKNMNHLKDLQDPNIARLFDWDGDGKADLIGCDRSWACYDIVESLLDKWKLRSTVTHVSKDYSPLMFELLRRYREDKPVLFYTWTPNWTTGVLRPNQDVIWLQGTEGQDAFPPNDIRVVAHREFLKNHPDINYLLAQVEIPLADISAQNALFLEGEDTEEDIRRHAKSWIKTHRNTIKRWLAGARERQSVPQQQEQLARATTQQKKLRLRVIVKRFEPLVTFDRLSYSGFALDLWDEIVQDMGAEVEVTAVNSLAKMIDEVEHGSGDVGISGVSMTFDRESRIDFSHPFYDSGLQILIPAEENGRWAFASALLQALFSKGLLLTLFLLMLCLFLAANVLWWFERSHQHSDFSSHYGRGIIDALWWAAVTVTTVGDGKKTPRNVSGKIFAIVWMFAGYFVLAYFTASVSSSLTLERLQGNIQGPEDLRGKRVATVTHSQAEDYLKAEGIVPSTFGSVDQAIDAMKSGKIDAVVYHEPVLRYYAAHSEANQVQVVGNIFKPQSYAFVLPVESPHREAINRSLLKLRENGRYEALRRKWFGKNPK